MDSEAAQPAQFLKYFHHSNTDSKIKHNKVTLLWKMSLLKLLSLFPSSKELAVLLYERLSYRQIREIFVSDLMDYIENLELCSDTTVKSDDVPHSLENSKLYSDTTVISDDVPHSLENLTLTSNITVKSDYVRHCLENLKLSSEMTVKYDDNPHNLEILKPCLNISDARNPSLEKSIDSYFLLENELHIPDDECNPDDTVSISHSLKSSATLSRSDKASTLNIQKVYSSVKFNEVNIPLKEEEYEPLKKKKAFDLIYEPCNHHLCRNVFSIQNSKVQKYSFSEVDETCQLLKEETDKLPQVPASDFTVKIYDWDSCTDVSGKCILSNLDVNKKFSEEGFFLKEVVNSQEGKLGTSELNSSLEISNKCISASSDLQIDNFSEADFLLRKSKLEECNFTSSGEISSKCISSNSGLQSKLLKCQVPKIEEESVQADYPTEEEIHINLSEESEILETFQDHAEEKGNAFLKIDNSNVSIDHSLDKTWKYDDLDDDCFLKILCSAFDFICRSEENASCMETQKLISEILVKSEDIIPEQYYVKSVQILLYFLDDVQRSLESRRDKAILLRLDYEAMLKELDSYDNTKEGKELKETAKNTVIRCDEMCAGIDEDRLECEWYSKNLQEILNFFQKKTS